MNRGLEQNATDVMNHPTVQKTVATAMIGTASLKALDWIPDAVALMAGIVGFIVSVTIIMRNRAETRKLNIQAEILEGKERKRKEDMQIRFERGEPCRRCTDDIISETKEGE